MLVTRHPLTSLVGNKYYRSQWISSTGYQHSSKYLILCPTKERNSFLGELSKLVYMPWMMWLFVCTDRLDILSAQHTFWIISNHKLFTSVTLLIKGDVVTLLLWNNLYIHIHCTYSNNYRLILVNYMYYKVAVRVWFRVSYLIMHNVLLLQ